VTRCQRTNTGVAAQVARWLADHAGSRLVLDGPDHRLRYLLERGGDVLGRFRTVGEFAMAIETPGEIAWS
jgi:hypothetical protein